MRVFKVKNGNGAELPFSIGGESNV